MTLERSNSGLDNPLTGKSVLTSELRFYSGAAFAGLRLFQRKEKKVSP